MRDGKPEEALALYRQTLQTSPNSVPANIAAGSVLDLMGEGEKARKYFTKAMDIADTPEGKVSAKRAIAMSMLRGELQENRRVRTTGFRLPRQREELLSAGRDCERGGSRLYRFRRFGHGVQVVRDWPRYWAEGTRHQARSARPVELPLGHAQARIAARRGDQAEAQKHVAAAKAILDKGTNPEQAPFFPYLKGYVAFYTGITRRLLRN